MTSKQPDTGPKVTVTLQQDDNSPVKVLNYICTGKLTLFPAIIMFLGCGSGWLLTYGDANKSEIDNQQNWSYTAVGALLLILSSALLASMLIWLVLRVSFIITPTQFKVLKSGLLRSSILEFDINNITLHYFRTHFIEERSWLQLVVCENNQFYQIFSWKGKGNQKERFKKLFKTLRNTVREMQQSNGYQVQKLPSEIVSTRERNYIGPFTDRLKQISSTDDQEYPLCIEDIPVVSFDSFFNHFKLNKKKTEEPLDLVE